MQVRSANDLSAQPPNPERPSWVLEGERLEAEHVARDRHVSLHQYIQHFKSSMRSQVADRPLGRTSYAIYSHSAWFSALRPESQARITHAPASSSRAVSQLVTSFRLSRLTSWAMGYSL